MNTYIIIGLAVGLLFVLILIRVIYRKEKSSVKQKYQTLNFVLNDPLIKTKVKEYLNGGKKIEAIKYVHEKSSIGLVQAKKYVEDLQAGDPSDNYLKSSTEVNQKMPSEGNDISIEIKQLISKGNKIQAIKLVTENFNIGLKEAKDFVEAIEGNLNSKK